MAMLERLRVVFMGTPEFALPTLKALTLHHDVVAVYTRPDAVSGRGSKLLPSAVRAYADKLAIPVFTPTSLSLTQNANFGQHEANPFEPAPDIIVVAAYGLLLPPSLINAARLGAVNLHASLLPRWRGAAPVQRAILAGDNETGVCIMRVVEQLDAGAYCASASVSIGEKSATALTDELARLGAALLLEQLPLIANGEAVWVEQDDAAASYAKRISKRELLLSPDLTACDNIRRIRAASAQAQARCRIAGRDVSIVTAKPLQREVNGGVSAGCGSVVINENKLLLLCLDDIIEVEKLKPAGKQLMDARDFLNGLPKAKELRWETI